MWIFCSSSCPECAAGDSIKPAACRHGGECDQWEWAPRGHSLLDSQVCQGCLASFAVAVTYSKTLLRGVMHSEQDHVCSSKGAIKHIRPGTSNAAAADAAHVSQSGVKRIRLEALLVCMLSLQPAAQAASQHRSCVPHASARD